MSTEIQKIITELETIKQELGYIKENMIDKDMFLDLEEKQLLKESYENEKTSKLTSSKDLKKELGL